MSDKVALETLVKVLEYPYFLNANQIRILIPRPYRIRYLYSLSPFIFTIVLNMILTRK